jgi:hypothetical protein
MDARYSCPASTTCAPELKCVSADGSSIDGIANLDAFEVAEFQDFGKTNSVLRVQTTYSPQARAWCQDQTPFAECSTVFSEFPTFVAAVMSPSAVKFTAELASQTSPKSVHASFLSLVAVLLLLGTKLGPKLSECLR